MSKSAVREQTARAVSSAPPPWPPHWLSLGHAFVHKARLQPNAPAISDSTGVKLTYNQTLIKALALANVMRAELGTAKYVGVLLPPSAGAVLVNIALTLLDKVAVNLNYTLSQKLIDSCIQQCEIKHVLTSQATMKRMSFNLDSATLLPLEELRKKATIVVKAWSWTEADAMPEQMLSRFFPGLAKEHNHDRLDETAAIIFTTGSTGDPKGVMLSHRNILSDIAAVRAHIDLTEKDVMLGILPFFHSFGYTIGMWTVLSLGLSAVYHYDPFDSQIVGDLCQKFGATIMFCTPTIMGSYVRRCHPEQFKTIRLCALGGEQLREQLSKDVENKLGIIPVQGYGLTETSPVVSADLPYDIKLDDGRTVKGNRPGTVGLPLPATKIRIVRPGTSEEVPTGTEGMIEVNGPQVMKGYLNRPKETKEVMNGNWFITGDIGMLDSDGFLKITGRQSQFSKIGGEMVPHLAVEHEIQKIAQADEATLCVTSAPDAKRGERLVVVHSQLSVQPAEIVEKLRQSGVSKLWIPDPQNFYEVKELPKLGTGKIDLRAIKEIAAERSDEKKAS